MEVRGVWTLNSNGMDRRGCMIGEGLLAFSERIRWMFESFASTSNLWTRFVTLGPEH